MQPDTDYFLQARGGTEAGVSEWCATEPYLTAAPRVPSAPLIVRPDTKEQVCDDECHVEWTAPVSDGGAQITGYRIEYASMSDAVTVMDTFTSYADPLPAHQLQLSMRHLRPSTYYTVRLFAMNEWGQSVPDERVILTPGSLVQPAGVSAGTVVLIVLLVLVGVCAVIDIACYFLNQCGFIMFLCVNCCGRAAPEHSMKHRDMHAMEQAHRNDDTQLLKSQGAPPCEDKEPLETTPLNGSPETGLTGKATTV
jgi:hypothetical protein